MLGKEHAYRFSQISAWAEVRSFSEMDDVVQDDHFPNKSSCHSEALAFVMV